MKIPVYAYLLWVLALATLVACKGGGEPVPESVVSPGTEESGADESGLNYESLLNRLQAEGLNAEASDEEIEQPFFSVRAQIIVVGEEQVQVFEFPDEATAQAEAATIAPDGFSVGTSMISWMSTPHFYQDGTLLVLYVGNDSNVLAALDAVLGKQIAGG